MEFDISGSLHGRGERDRSRQLQFASGCTSRN